MGTTGLPTARETTFAASAKVLGNVINALLDAILGRFFPATWAWTIPLGRAASEVNLTWDAVNGKITATGAANFDFVPIAPGAGPFVGDRITTIGARVLGTGAGGNVTVSLMRDNGDGSAVTEVVRLTIVTPPAAWALYTVALAPCELAVDRNAYFFRGTLATAGQAIATLGYQSDRGA